MSAAVSVPEHSKLSPSAASRWTKCTASIYLAALLKEAKTVKGVKAAAAFMKKVEAFLPGTKKDEFFDTAKGWIEDTTSAAAELGTEAHAWAEKVLKGEIKLHDVPEDFKHVGEYTAHCESLQNRWGGQRFVEARVPLFYYPDESGTTDFALVGGDRICVVDYKNGIGVLVEAVDNRQMASYALSFIRDMEDAVDTTDETIVDIWIVQPRTQTGDTIKNWQTTLGELKKFAEPIQEKADLILSALSGDAEAVAQLEFQPSKGTCQFCNCKYVCGARNTLALEPITESTDPAIFDTLVIREGNIPLLTREGVLAIFKNRDVIKKIIDGAEQFLMEQAASGNPVPGTKMVAGRKGNRKWADDEGVKTKLLDFLPEEDILKVELRSPAQIEALLKEAQVPKDIVDAFATLVTRSEGKPKLVMEDDPRPAIADASDLFEGIQDEENHED